MKYHSPHTPYFIHPQIKPPSTPNIAVPNQTVRFLLRESLNKLLMSSINTRADCLRLSRVTITLQSLALLEMVQLLTSCVFSPQHISLEPPRQRLCKLILGMCSRRNAKHVVQLLESSLLGLWQEQEDEHQSDDVHAGVEPECTLYAEGFQLPRKRERDDGGPEVVGCYSPGHADFSMAEREYFGRVCEWDGSFSWRVESVVDVDEECYETEVGSAGWRDVV